MESVTIPHQARDRHYWLVGPTAEWADGPCPLLVMLHGTGGSGEWAEEEIGWMEWQAQTGELFVVLPDGLPLDPGMPARFLSNPARWNDGSEPPGELRVPLPDDVGFLTAVIHYALQRCSADPNRVYLSGFSNGAGMCFRLAAEQSALLAGIAPVAGYCPAGLPRPVRPIPTLYLIGTADPLVPVNGGTVRLPWGNRQVQRPSVWMSLESWARAIDCEPIPLRHSEQHGVTTYRYPAIRASGAPFEVAIIDGLGHHWPGGRGRMNPRIAGPWISTVDARERIWAFLRQHRRH